MNRLIESIKNKLTTKAKFTYEEQRYKSGELFIKKIVKNGDEAEKEIEKHSEVLSSLVSDFIKSVIRMKT